MICIILLENFLNFFLSDVSSSHILEKCCEFAHLDDSITRLIKVLEGFHAGKLLLRSHHLPVHVGDM